MKHFIAYITLAAAVLALSGCGDNLQSSDNSKSNVTEATPVNEVSGNINMLFPNGDSGGSAAKPKNSVTLSWSIPVTRQDNTPLPFSEISGYKIYYFLVDSPEEQGAVISIDNPNNTEYTTDTLLAGTYYFSIATIDSYGLHSEISDPVQTTVSD